jgi:hypothetical protein
MSEAQSKTVSVEERSIKLKLSHSPHIDLEFARDSSLSLNLHQEVTCKFRGLSSASIFYEICVPGFNSSSYTYKVWMLAGKPRSLASCLRLRAPISHIDHGMCGQSSFPSHSLWSDFPLRFSQVPSNQGIYFNSSWCILKGNKEKVAVHEASQCELKSRK